MQGSTRILIGLMLCALAAGGCSTTKAALKAKNRMMQMRIHELEAEKDRAKQQIKLYRDEVDSTKKQAAAIQKERDSLKKEKTEHVKVVDVEKQKHQALKSKLEQELKGLDCLVLSRGNDIVLRLNVGVISGGVEVDKAGQKLLRAVVDALRTHAGDSHLVIEGHTDDKPIMTEKFPSNWELSGARAVTVLRFLVDRCGVAPERVSFAGHGEYAPAVPNVDAKSRARNRRIEIVVLAGGQ